LRIELLSHTSSHELLTSLPASEVPEREFLAHLGFTFAIEGISRACSHQLVRHRVASFSQQSQRYIPVKNLTEHVVVPSSVEEKAGKDFENFIKNASDTYKSLVEDGVPREDARFVLPNAAETSLLMTIDGRSLMHFFGLRLCSRAQWEVKTIAEEMLRQVKVVEPDLFMEAGPYCVQLGRCPEGKFSCNKISEVKRKYSTPNL
jgi:thymidylate synthase (FAD)